MIVDSFEHLRNLESLSIYDNECIDENFGGETLITDLFQIDTCSVEESGEQKSQTSEELKEFDIENESKAMMDEMLEAQRKQHKKQADFIRKTLLGKNTCELKLAQEKKISQASFNNTKKLEIELELLKLQHDKLALSFNQTLALKTEELEFVKQKMHESTDLLNYQQMKIEELNVKELEIVELKEKIEALTQQNLLHDEPEYSFATTNRASKKSGFNSFVFVFGAFYVTYICT